MAETEQASPDPQAWGFVGAGRMGSALLRGMVATGAIDPTRVLVTDINAPARTELAKAAGARVAESSTQVTRACGVIVLAIKPQALEKVALEVAESLTADHLVISILAGVSLRRLRGELGPDCRLARVMPNLPVLVAAGASAYCMGTSATEADEQLVRTMLTAVGQCHQVSESLMDAVTGLSGSGPAFVFTMIEALSDGGVRTGLPRDIATALATQTVLGAARMVLETSLHPAVLREHVTSPGGSTITGVHALEQGGLRAAVMDAVLAATSRAQALDQDAASK